AADDLARIVIAAEDDVLEAGRGAERQGFRRRVFPNRAVGAEAEGAIFVGPPALDAARGRPGANPVAPRADSGVAGDHGGRRHGAVPDGSVVADLAVLFGAHAGDDVVDPQHAT